MTKLWKKNWNLKKQKKIKFHKLTEYADSSGNPHISGSLSRQQQERMTKVTMPLLMMMAMDLLTGSGNGCRCRARVFNRPNDRDHNLEGRRVQIVCIVPLGSGLVDVSSIYPSTCDRCSDDRCSFCSAPVNDNVDWRKAPRVVSD